MQPEDPLADEIAGMVDALLEDRLGPADVRRLEELVCTSPAARRIYLQYIHLNCSIPPHLGMPTPEPALPEESAAPLPGQPADMSETLMMPALRAARADDEPSIVAPAAPRGAAMRRAGIFPLRRYAVAAAILIAATVAIAMYWNRGPQKNVSQGVPTHPSPAATQAAPVAPPVPAVVTQPVAHLTALAHAVMDGPGVLRPGEPLLPGQSLRLKSGAAEVTYANGAVLVVEGPASLRITDGSTAQLDRGKIAARVPHEARWFRVTSSKMTVTDLGTEFGVDVSPAGIAVAHVFEGRITVALPGPSPDSTDVVRLLDRDQTVQCPIAGGLIESVPKFTETFTRDIAQYARALPLHNTGAGVPEGSPDPNWQFVANSNDPALAPRPATVAGAYVSTQTGKPSYFPNSTTSRWISTQGKLASMPAGTYTFRTEFNLSGLGVDAATVKILAHVAADDEVQRVRVNGREVPLPNLGDPGRQYTRFHDFAISQGFVGGLNTVEFDVLNSKEQMALRVEWEGTAMAHVIR
jgi:hypothetical protein